MFQTWNWWAVTAQEIKRIKHKMAKVITIWTAKTMAHAWGKWASTSMEAKRVRYLMDKVTRHWTGAFTARAWETWSNVASEGRRMRVAASRVLVRWGNQSMSMMWNAWLKKTAQARQLKMAASKVLRRWGHQGLAGGWNRWVLTVKEEKRRRKIMQKVVARCSKGDLMAAWETWSKLAREERRLRKAAFIIVHRLENKGMWVAWHTWSSNAAEMARIKAVSLKVVLRWQQQALGAAFERWLGKKEEERRMRQVVYKVVRRWVHDCLRRAFCGWESVLINESMRASKEEEQMRLNALEAALASKAAESEDLLSNMLSQVEELESALAAKSNEASRLYEEGRYAERKVEELQQDLAAFCEGANSQRMAMLSSCRQRLISLAKQAESVLNSKAAESKRVKIDLIQRLDALHDEHAPCASTIAERDAEIARLSKGMIALETRLTETIDEREDANRVLRQHLNNAQDNFATMQSEMSQRIRDLEEALAAKSADVADLEKEMLDAAKKLDGLQLEVNEICEDSVIARASLLHICKNKFADLGEVCRKAEREAERLQERNVECEQLMHDAQEKLAHAKHEMALELTTKQADIARLHSQVEELKVKNCDDDEDAIVFSKVCGHSF
jgi:hypothetical protein